MRNDLENLISKGKPLMRSKKRQTPRGRGSFRPITGAGNSSPDVGLFRSAPKGVK